MKKIVKIKNELNLKKVKQISSTLLSFPEIEDLEIDLDNNSISILFNTDFSDDILKYYLKSINFEIENII